MKKRIEVKDLKIEYKLRRSKRAKYMRLSIAPDASVTATLPYRCRIKDLEKFIISKADWLADKINEYKNAPNYDIYKRDDVEYKECKEKARELLTKKVEYFCKIYKFKYNRLYIRRQKTRWGSCSSKNNLSFNYKIIFLPEYLIDYIVVHELCHLKEMNHSKRFWNLVAREIPNYKRCIKELRDIHLREK